MKKKRIVSFALAAALILALGVTAYAVAGHGRSTATHSMPLEGEYTSLSELPKAEQIVGFPITAPERFSNGYAFSSLRVNGQGVYDEENALLAEYYDVSVRYTLSGAPDILLTLSSSSGLPGGGEPPEPSFRRMIGGVEASYSLDRYKLVPEDYAKTAEDLAAESAGHFYVSFGADRISEQKYAFIEFTLDGAKYVLMDAVPGAEPFARIESMAAELIAAARG